MLCLSVEGVNFITRIMAVACQFEQGLLFYIQQPAEEEIPVIHLDQWLGGLASASKFLLNSVIQNEFQQECKVAAWPDEGSDGSRLANEEIMLAGAVYGLTLEHLGITEMVCMGQVGLGLGSNKKKRERAAELALALALVTPKSYDANYGVAFKKLLEDREKALRMIGTYKRFSDLKSVLRPKTPAISDGIKLRREPQRKNPTPSKLAVEAISTSSSTGLPYEPQKVRPLPLHWADALSVQISHPKQKICNEEAIVELDEGAAALRRHLEGLPREYELEFDLTRGTWAWQNFVSFLPDDVISKVIGVGIHHFSVAIQQACQEGGAEVSQPYFLVEQINGVRHRLWFVGTGSESTVICEQQESLTGQKRTVADVGTLKQKRKDTMLQNHEGKKHRVYMERTET